MKKYGWVAAGIVLVITGVMMMMCARSGPSSIIPPHSQYGTSSGQVRSIVTFPDRR